MATYTIEQARAYYNTLPPEEKVKVDGIGGPSVEWLTNAVNAGVPDAIAAVGGKKGATEGGWEEEGGYTLPWEDAAEPEEWLGKRPPTPSELRKYARRAGWSEDFERYTDRQLAAWLKDWDVGANKFRNPGGDLVEKPSEGGSSWSPGGGGGGGGGGPAFPGGGPGGLSDWWGTLGDAPVFEAPTWESAMEDPGYQAALKAGEGALGRSQAAKGVLRTGGSLKDLLDYNQGMAAKQYDSAWQRALGKYQTEYAPWATKFGAGENRWSTMYGGDLAKWQTQYQGDLAKYLQKEGNLFDLLNSPPPMYGG